MFVKPGQEEKVCKLNSHCTVKTSCREWYRRLDDYLVRLGFKNTVVHPCVYVDSNENRDTVIVVYVDDLLIASANLPNVIEIKQKLGREFKMKDLVTLKIY